MSCWVTESRGGERRRRKRKGAEKERKRQKDAKPCFPMGWGSGLIRRKESREGKEKRNEGNNYKHRGKEEEARKEKSGRD